MSAGDGLGGRGTSQGIRLPGLDIKKATSSSRERNSGGGLGGKGTSWGSGQTFASAASCRDKKIFYLGFFNLFDIVTGS